VSQENVAILEAFKPPSGMDWVRLIHDDATWNAAANPFAAFADREAVIRIGVGMGEATRTYIGRDGFRAAFIDWLDPWEEYYVAVLETIDCGERVLRLTEHTGRLRGSVSTATLDAAEVWRFRDGMIVSLETYPGHEEGRRAVGLQE
jgi:hypothetical protein